MLKIVAIYAAIVTVAAAALFWLFVGAREDLAASEMARKAEVAALTTEIKGLEGEKALLEKDIAFRQRQIDHYGQIARDTQAQLDKKAAEYDAHRTTLAARTLAKPEVARRAARAAINERMRRACALTGGSPDECRTPASPGTAFAAPRAADRAGAGGGDAGAQPPVERGSPGR